MINNALDIRPYQARLARYGRAQLRDFLQLPAAERLRDCLEREVRWEPAQRSDRPPLIPQEMATGNRPMRFGYGRRRRAPALDLNSCLIGTG